MHSKYVTCAFALIAIIAGCATGEDNPSSDAGGLGGAAGTAGAAGKAGASAGGSAGSAEGGSGGTGGGSCTPSAEPTCHLLVNEVMTETSTASSDEFVEIYNPCAKVQLPGFRLVYRAASGSSDVVLFKFTAGSIDPCEYMIIAGTEWSGGQAYGTFISGGLSAEGGGVAIHDGTNVVDSMGWGSATNSFVEGSPPPGPAADSSLGRSPNAKDTDDNEADFKIYDSPSPGAANP